MLKFVQEKSLLSERARKIHREIINSLYKIHNNKSKRMFHLNLLLKNFEKHLLIHCYQLVIQMHVVNSYLNVSFKNFEKGLIFVYLTSVFWSLLTLLLLV